MAAQEKYLKLIGNGKRIWHAFKRDQKGAGKLKTTRGPNWQNETMQLASPIIKSVKRSTSTNDGRHIFEIKFNWKRSPWCTFIDSLNQP